LSCLNIGYSPDITELILNTGAFQNCNKLTNINLNKVVKIPNNCFEGCTSLTNLEIPATEISDYSFQNCPKLNSVKINNATIIKEGAFK
jgi:hypothetical protein